MTKPRRCFLVSAGLGCIALLTDCGPKSESTNTFTSTAKVRIGFLVKRPEDPWFQREWAFAEQAANDLGFDLEEVGAPDSAVVMASIDRLATEGAGGLIICTPDRRLGPAIAARSRAVGLKLISVDDRFIGADGHPMPEVHHFAVSDARIGQSVGLAENDGVATRMTAIG